MGIRGESAGVIPVLNPPAPVDRAVAAPYRAYEVCMGIRGVVSRGNSRSESTSTGRPGCGCALPGLRGRQGYQGGVNRGNFRSESASTSRPGCGCALPGLRGLYGYQGGVSRGNFRSESASTGRPGCGCALPGLRGLHGYQGGVSRGNSRSESASTSRPGQALAATRHKPGLRIQTRFVISRIGFTGFWRRCQASACASRVMGCSQRLLVDISICHLQVSQSVIARSAPLSSICRNSGAPMACEEG